MPLLIIFVVLLFVSQNTHTSSISTGVFEGKLLISEYDRLINGIKGMSNQKRVTSEVHISSKW